MIAKEKRQLKRGFKNGDSINMKGCSKADICDNLISLSAPGPAKPKEQQICTFCTDCKAQYGMMSLNPTHTSPKHVRQRITAIQLRRYGQISQCDWIPRSEAHLSGPWVCVPAAKCATQSVKWCRSCFGRN